MTQAAYSTCIFHLVQVGRAARDGSQGAAVVITTKGDTGHKNLKKLFCKKRQGRQKEPGCLVGGLSKIFQLSNPDGIQLCFSLRVSFSSSHSQAPTVS